ncbi:MAG: hypothetical protein GXO57_05490 [Thermodesulfobacteria bacterium]|nr:hypothetical protein [Thermodesulfobacteriota bacterium]
MKSKKNFKIYLSFLFSILFFISSFRISIAQSNFKLVDKVVAVVGDQFLTLYELKQLCKPFLEDLSQKQLPPEEKKKAIEEVEKSVLESWIENTIVQQEAEKYGISVSDEDVENYIKNEVKALGGIKAFKKFLKAQGISLEEYKKRIKKKLLAIKFVQLQVHQKILITDQELKKAYQEYVRNFKKVHPTGYQYVISLLKSKDEKVIKKAYELLKSKKSLKDVAKTLNGEVSFIPKVNYLKRDLSPEVLKVLDALKPGQISQPVKIGEEYFVVKLLYKGEVKPLPFSEVKNHLYQKLFQEKAQKFIKKLIKELKEKRYIKVFSF